MDKRNKRNEATDKKIDSKIKGMGDLKKVIIKKTDGIAHMDIRIPHPERGDSERKISTNQKPEKMRINIFVKKETNDELKFKNINSKTVKEVARKKTYAKDGNDKVELEYRKRIRDKYTLKLKSTVNKTHSNSNLNKKDERGKIIEDVMSDDSKNANGPKKKLTEETTQTEENLFSSTSSAKTDLNNDKKSEKSTAKLDKTSTKHELPTSKGEKRRKPIIKTITSKNGPYRIYKTVTFVDQRKGPPTPLEIKIPNETKRKQKAGKLTDTNSLGFRTKPSRTSIKEKPVTVRKKRDRRRDRKHRIYRPSPDCSIRDIRTRSPPTEVARWAPCSIDAQTRPYYEAWVNTTLAAISKGTKKDRLFLEKQRDNILRSFKKALEERPRSPELFYENFADEKYTGRIKITQR